MGTNLPEDPMDLGSFMQNFVFNNPFSNTADAVPQSTGGSPGDGCAEADKKPVSLTGSSPEAKHLSDGTDFIVQDKMGQVVDTPKGHIGSNAAYAAFLKNCHVSLNHQDVQQWLWDNLLHLPQLSNLYPAERLMLQVQEIFPHISGTVLSRIMKFSFPDCPKTSLRSGVFYIGLLKKPTEKELKSSTVKKALDVWRKGKRTLNRAAEEFGVSENLLLSVLTWTGDGALFGREPARKEDGQLDQDLLVHLTDEENMTKLLRWRQKRPGSKSTREHPQSSCAKRHKTNHQRVSRNSRAQNKIPPSVQPAVDIKVELDNLEPEAPKSCMPTDSPDKSGQSESLSPSELNPRLLGTLLSKAGDNSGASQSSAKTVKQEPPDSGYEYTQESNYRSLSNTLDRHPDVPVDSSCDSVISVYEPNSFADQGDSYVSTTERPSPSKVNGHDDMFDDDTRNDDSSLQIGALRNLVVNELAAAKRQLTEQIEINEQLLQELRSSEQVVISQQDELRGRDSQLLQLAEEFQDLNSRFTRLAHRFKAVLNSSGQLADSSCPSSNFNAR